MFVVSSLSPLMNMACTHWMEGLYTFSGCSRWLLPSWKLGTQCAGCFCFSPERALSPVLPF